MNELGIQPSTWIFAQPMWFSALWGVLLLIVVLAIASRLLRKRINRYVDPEIEEAVIGRRRNWPSVVRASMLLLAICAVVVALARPQSDPREVEVETKGRDVVFLLDVSRSMLARDVAPNRLERAKLWINDLVDELHGDRVALVAFAGSSSVVSPLTTDKLFFKLALDELDTDAVPRGGTNIGDAIRRIMNMVFTSENESEFAHRDIILITDGEDQESLPVQAAQAAGEQGVRIIALGIGSRDGSLVPADPNSPSGSNRQVRSSLQSASLTQISAATPGGVYLEVGTGTIDLAKVYRDLIASAEQRTIETAKTTQYQERFMILLWIALVLVLLESLLITTRTRSTPCVPA